MPAAKAEAAHRRVSGRSWELGIGFGVKEARSSDAGAAARHVRLDVIRDVAFEGQLELHAARVIDEELPKHRARHKKLAPVETRRLEP